MSHNLRHLFATALVVAAASGAAHAQFAGFQTLNAGAINQIVPTPTLTGTNNGTLQPGSLVVAPFDVNNAGQRIAGNLVSAVYRVDATTLDFVYQLQLNSNTNSSVVSYSFASFAGFATNVGQTQTDVDGASASFASASNNIAAGTAGSANSSDTNKSTNGVSIFDNFTGLPTGVSFNTTTYVVRVTGSGFTTTGGATVSGGAVSANIATNVAAPVTIQTSGPEPASFLLAAFGLVAFGGVAARRRK